MASLLAPPATNAGPEELAKAKDCFSCHKVDGSRVGPSFVEAAKKYARDPEARAKLVRQIQEGSVGRTGDPTLPPQPIVATLSHFATGAEWRKVSMPPQRGINLEEAEQLADWILSLDR